VKKEVARTHFKTLRKVIMKQAIAWFFRFSSPFFGWSETAVQKGFAPVQLLALVQFG